MPTYQAYGPIGVQVASGDTYTLFSAETPTAPANSVVIFPVDSGPVERSAITFQMHFASAPTAVVEILGSNTPPTRGAGGAPQNGVVLYTSTNLQNDNYTDSLAFACYWAEVVSQSGGGAVTVTAHVR